MTSPQSGPARRENNVRPFWRPQAMGRPSGELTPVRMRSAQQRLTRHLDMSHLHCQCDGTLELQAHSFHDRCFRKGLAEVGRSTLNGVSTTLWALLLDKKRGSKRNLSLASLCFTMVVGVCPAAPHRAAAVPSAEGEAVPLNSELRQPFPSLSLLVRCLS